MFSQKQQEKLRDKSEGNIHLESIDPRASKEPLNEQLRISINTKAEQAEPVSFA